VSAFHQFLCVLSLIERDLPLNYKNQQPMVEFVIQDPSDTVIAPKSREKGSGKGNLPEKREKERKKGAGSKSGVLNQRMNSSDDEVKELKPEQKRAADLSGVMKTRQKWSSISRPRRFGPTSALQRPKILSMYCLLIYLLSVNQLLAIQSILKGTKTAEQV
jgi:hypothetical protein